MQISQQAGKVVWYFHLFKNSPRFIVIPTVKGFGIVNKADVDVFLELSCFLDDPVDVGNLISCQGPALADPGYSKERQLWRPIYLFIYQR